MKKLRRLEIGPWRFCLGFGSYAFRWRRDAKRAGSIGFGFGLVTYMRRGEYVPLKTRQTSAR